MNCWPPTLTSSIIVTCLMTIVATDIGTTKASCWKTICWSSNTLSSWRSFNLSNPAYYPICFIYSLQELNWCYYNLCMTNFRPCIQSNQQITSISLLIWWEIHFVPHKSTFIVSSGPNSSIFPSFYWWLMIELDSGSNIQ